MSTLATVLWAYRSVVLGSIKGEFQSKYRHSLVGAGWTVLNPLAMIIVDTVIFAQVIKAKQPGCRPVLRTRVDLLVLVQLNCLPGSHSTR